MKTLEAPKHIPKLINAETLLNFLAHAGPASNIRVRVYHQDGSVHVGIVKWHDDRYNNGPVIAIEDKNSPDNGGLIPLGGEIVYTFPPKISSMNNARVSPHPLGKVTAVKKSIEPSALKLSFEIISQN